MGRPARPAIDRFTEKYVVNEETGCWEWTAYLDKDGYGYFKADGENRAHRWAYINWKGPMSSYLVTDHLCRNRRCVNPEHLEEVSTQENTRRGINDPNRLGQMHAAKTHCPVGHPYDEINTRLYDGRRYCIACTNRRAKEQRLRNKSNNTLIDN